MRVKFAVVIASLAALGGSVPVLAHHSFAAEFDSDNPIDLTGTVTKIEWMNPHTFIYLDVQNDQGDYENWALEMGSPNGLMRRGWTRNTLKVGDVVSVMGSRARDGTLKGNARAVMLPNGERLFSGSSQPGAEPQEPN
jgi:hypothetical protein